jgi:hypothetical protein
VKLSRGLVLTGWWARPNCNLVLNCADSSWCFLRQKLHGGRRISSSEFVKRPLCNIHQNRWRITRVAQPKRRLLHLESCSYNKSHPNPKAYCFSKSVNKKPLLIWSPCLASLNSACISFTLTKCASWLKSIIEPYWSSFKQVPYLVMVHLSSHVIWSHKWLQGTILFELAKETLFSITTVVAPQVSPCIYLGP